MTEHRGPVIDHDGKGFPFDYVRAEMAKGANRMIRTVEGSGRSLTPKEQQKPDELDPQNPGWTWGKKLFRGIVCSDPAYKRIVEYQLVYEIPPAAKNSGQVELLKAIARQDIQPSEDPEQKVEAEETT